MRLAVALLLLTACTVPLVSTERAHLSWHHRGRLEKLGVSVEGYTCGEQYMRAVAGVPEAEDLMRRCHRANTVYGYGMLGFLVAPAVGGVVAWQTDVSAKTAIPVSLGVGAVSFMVGFVAAYFAGRDLREAVAAYNMSVDSGVEQR